MKKVLLGGGLFAAVVVGSANADFVGWAANSYGVADTGGNYAVIDVYAMFSVGTDKLLNVFNMNISLGGAPSFFQSDIVPGTGTWTPFPSFTNALSDSFVTIGQVPGFANTTTLDPNFTNANSNAAPSANAGWYNGNPGAFTATAGAVVTNQNTTGSNLGVHIGRFTVVGTQTGGRTLGMNGFAAFNTGQNSSSNKTFSYVPAPGALALLGLAGLAGRRRRA